MAKKKVSSSKKDESKALAWVASFFTIIGFIIALIIRRDDEYVMYYAKQGLVLFVGFAIASVIQWIPVVGALFMIFMVILWVLSWVNALSGQKKPTWIIQDLAEKIKI